MRASHIKRFWSNRAVEPSIAERDGRPENHDPHGTGWHTWTVTGDLEHVTPATHTRQAVQRAIQRITTAWPHALVDAQARGYSTRGYNTAHATGELTTVEAAALNACYATLWILAVERLAYGCDDRETWITQVIGLGNQACLHWPTPPSKGSTINGVTVGARTNPVETCVWCGQPVLGGQRDPIRRVGINSDPVHKTPCWYAYQTGRTLRPVTLSRQQQQTA